MSRGPGAAQRFVLDRLAQEQGNKPWDRWVTASTIARDRAGKEPTAAEAESVRRAIRTLARDEKVETRLDRWYGVLLARLPLTAAERKADQAHEKREAERAEKRAWDNYEEEQARKAAQKVKSRG